MLIYGHYIFRKKCIQNFDMRRGGGVRDYGSPRSITNKLVLYVYFGRSMIYEADFNSINIGSLWLEDYANDAVSTRELLYFNKPSCR